ncbi:hypothetical protein [Periweissella fabalis]|uniref:Lipoprotein n=1 Tax=Periweissella fabalis TaxID=1070421 RepID=A0A7X6S324_9LACO|nr:hypothetical protein [Periweissella fabalis]MCM0599258.1 hypothetical protein [Periweissella fabalis]NKZ23537.1 hypothetical protein [Periweissella fabalis]
MLTFKKFSLVIPVALLVGTLAGCSQASSKTTNSSSSSDPTNTIDSDPHPSRNSSSIDTTTTQDNPAAEESTAGLIKAQPTTQRNRIKDLNTSLKEKLGNVALPQVSGLTQGNQNLNITFNGDHNNYTINYTVGDKPLEFNKTAVNGQNPYAVLQKQTFSSANEAKQQVSYVVAEDAFGGMPVTGLKAGITAFYDQGAGNTHLYWNEGNWSLGVKTDINDDKKPDILAHQVVDWLDHYYLPAPKEVGQIAFNSTISPEIRDQVIRWQDGTMVFTLTANDPETAIKMVASMH